jgi:hypothetical protein
MSGAAPRRVASSWAALRNGWPYECRLGVQVQADPPWRGPPFALSCRQGPFYISESPRGPEGDLCSLGRLPTSRLELHVYLDMQRHPYER